ncbi:MAG TPA: TetR/AcrR family transcriptional regulator [Solirubrobacterales bacterium]|nr:TetR/AcrR family transcriptional regulator [Solirubrobacterales bacterium]
MVVDKPNEEDPRDKSSFRPLPGGPHDLPADEVHRHQRERIFSAVAVVMAEAGYAGLTVDRIIALARISRGTFYREFANRREAAIGAHEQIFERFFASLVAACRTEDQWADKVKAAIGATLEFAAAEPAQAQVLATGMLAADLDLTRRVRDSYDRLAKLLSQGRRECPGAASLPQVTEQFLIGAIAAVLARQLISEGSSQLVGMHTELTQLTLIPYLGPVEARRAVA